MAVHVHWILDGMVDDVAVIFNRALKSRTFRVFSGNGATDDGERHFDPTDEIPIEILKDNNPMAERARR